MFDIAVGNNCQEERADFVIYAFLAFLFFLYCTTVTQKLLAEIEEEPRHLLKGVVSGAYYTRSLATQSIANQIRGEQAAALLFGEGADPQAEETPNFGAPPPLA